MVDKVIDAHQHFWQIDRPQRPDLPPDTPLFKDHLPKHLKPQMEELGVQETVLIQCIHSLDETRWLLQLAAEHPFIAGVVGWVDLTDANIGETLHELRVHPKLKGIRHLIEFDPDETWLLRKDVLRGLSELARHDLPFDLLVRPHHLRTIPTLAQRVPGLRLVIDHLAKPPIAKGEIAAWALAMKKVAAIPSVFCKLSGMITEADPQHWQPSDLKPYVEAVYSLFGEDRVMFGSDWPVCQLAGSYRQVYEALNEVLGPITQEQWVKVFGRNARTFYRLDG